MSTRDEFERWAKDSGYTIAYRYGYETSGDYDAAVTSAAWEAWQAAYLAGRESMLSDATSVTAERLMPLADIEAVCAIPLETK